MMYRPLTSVPAAVTSRATPQQAPFWWRPQWYVERLVFQGGVPRTRTASLAGGGFVAMRNPPGPPGVMWQPYATPQSSAMGGGFVSTRTPFLSPLANGDFGSRTF